MDAVAPPPFAAKVLTELKTALTGVPVTRSLLEEDPAFVAQFGAGDINQECMKFSGEWEAGVSDSEDEAHPTASLRLSKF